MCCNTKAGPQLALSELRRTTGIRVPIREWHQLKAKAEQRLGMKLTNKYSDASEVRRVAEMVAGLGSIDGNRERKLFIEAMGDERWAESSLYRIEQVVIDQPREVKPFRITEGGEPVNIEDLTERVGGWSPGDRTVQNFWEASYPQLRLRNSSLLDALDPILSAYPSGTKMRLTKDGRGFVATVSELDVNNHERLYSLAAFEDYPGVFSMWVVPHVVRDKTKGTRVLSKSTGVPSVVMRRIDADALLRSFPRSRSLPKG